MIKFTFLAVCFAAICSADPDDWDWNGKYKFEYGVNDPHTGDHKSQWEASDGHGVKGGYTLDEPDGTKRYVQYKADKWHGFHAIVKRVGHATHPKTYGAPFVVKAEKDTHKQSHNGHGYDEHGSVGFSGSGYEASKQSNGYQNYRWADQQASPSSYKNGNGWNTGNGEDYATSYVEQKSYY
nr:cuticle protein 19-like [Aedes albopictus]